MYHHLPPQLNNGDTTYIYSPTGQCVGRIPLSQLHLLHQRYHTTKAHSPHLWTLHSTGTFAGDVATLLSQHEDTTISNISPAIHKAMSTLGMTTDLDTSPLLMCPHLPMGNTPTPIDWPTVWPRTPLLHPTLVRGKDTPHEPEP